MPSTLQRVASGIEITLGVLCIFLAVYLWQTPGADPHGFIVLGCMVIAAFGLIALICGLLVRRGRIAVIVSQLAFLIACAFTYVELFTSNPW